MFHDKLNSTNSLNMEPSDELTEKVANAVQEMDAATVIKWVLLISSIPIFSNGYTILQEVLDDPKVESSQFDEDEDPDPGCIFQCWMESPSEHDNYLVCNFMSGNKACMKERDMERITAIEGQGAYGFTGTWEEVAHKLVELNNIILQPAPPFTF